MVEPAQDVGLPRVSGHVATGGMRGGRAQGFVPVWGKIVDGWVSPMGIVPTFDEFEHRLVCLGLGAEGTAI